MDDDAHKGAFLSKIIIIFKENKDVEWYACFKATTYNVR